MNTTAAHVNRWRLDGINAGNASELPADGGKKSVGIISLDATNVDLVFGLDHEVLNWAIVQAKGIPVLFEISRPRGRVDACMAIPSDKCECRMAEAAAQKRVVEDAWPEVVVDLSIESPETRWFCRVVDVERGILGLEFEVLEGVGAARLELEIRIEPGYRVLGCVVIVAAVSTEAELVLIDKNECGSTDDGLITVVVVQKIRTGLSEPFIGKCAWPDEFVGQAVDDRNFIRRFERWTYWNQSEQTEAEIRPGGWDNATGEEGIVREIAAWIEMVDIELSKGNLQDAASEINPFHHEQIDIRLDWRDVFIGDSKIDFIEEADPVVNVP